MAEKSKQELAEDRTDWAFQRNLLAEQRNFSAWIRTGLTAMAVGFAVVKLFGETRPSWVPPVVGALMVSAGIAVHLFSLWGYWRTFRALRHEGLPSLPIWSVAGVTLALVLGGSAMLVLILAEVGVFGSAGIGLNG